MLDENLLLENHLDNVCNKLSKNVFFTRRLSLFCSREILITTYYDL